MGALKSPGEWLKQAEYDMGTADCMLKAGIYIYAVFFCYSSIEKALKGTCHSKLGRIPPKTTNLMTLLKVIDRKLPEELYQFIGRLNDTFPGTLYPKCLAAAQEIYTEPVARAFLESGKQTLEWLKAQS